MSNDNDYQELRKLLVGPEQQELDAIRDDLKVTRDQQVSDVADVLSESIRLSNQQDSTLAQSLQPAVEDCIQQSVQKDAQFFADILFPIMGPAIRKSIADALKEVVDSINHAMEHSFSKKAVKWRWQALTTGKSYGEIVLKNTVLFRVDQVFLIQRETGMLMQHVAHPDWVRGEGKADSDAISAMLTAIQDFMRDSFNVTQNDQLDSIDMGDSTVLLSHGPKATVACKVRGVASAKLKMQMKEVIEFIHLNFFREMDDFDGDRAKMSISEPSLESLLVEEKKESESAKKKSFFTSPFFFIALLAAVLLCFYMYGQYKQHKAFDAHVKTLDESPGISITKADFVNKEIKGLFDPLSKFSSIQNVDENIDISYKFKKYQSLEPEIVKARASKLLNIPEAVDVRYEDSVLYLSGQLKNQSDKLWLENFSENKIYLSGISFIDTQSLQVEQGLKDFIIDNEKIINQINSTEIHFSKKLEVVKSESDKVSALVENLKALNMALKDTDWKASLIIEGYSDEVGSVTLNNKIREERSVYVKEQILSQLEYEIEAKAIDKNKVYKGLQNRKVTITLIVK